MSRVSTDQDQFQQVDFSTSPTALGQQKKSNNGWVIIVVIVLSIICAYYFFDKTFQVKSNIKQSQTVEALDERQAKNTTRTGNQNQNQQQISSNNKTRQVDESEEAELSLQQKLKLIEQKVIRDEQKYKKQSAEVKTVQQQQIEQQIKLEDQQKKKQLQDYQQSLNQQRDKIYKQFKQKQQEMTQKPFQQQQTTVKQLQQQIRQAEDQENFIQTAQQNKQQLANQSPLLLRQNLQQFKQKSKEVENQNKQNSILGQLESMILPNKAQPTGVIGEDNTNGKATTSNQGQVANPDIKIMQNDPTTAKTQSQEQQISNGLQTEVVDNPSIVSKQITDTSTTGIQINKPQISLPLQPQKSSQIEIKQQGKNAATFFSQKEGRQQNYQQNRIQKVQKVQSQPEIKQTPNNQPSLNKQQQKTDDSAASQTKQEQIEQMNKQQTQKQNQNQPSNKNSNNLISDEQKQKQKQQKPQHPIVEDEQTKIQPKSVDKIQNIEPVNEESANIEGKQKDDEKLDNFSQQFKDMIARDYQLGNESDKQILAMLDLIRSKAKNKNKNKNTSATDNKQTLSISEDAQKTKAFGEQQQKQEEEIGQNKESEISQPAGNVQIINNRKNPSHRTPQSILKGQQADQNTKKQKSQTQDQKLAKDKQTNPSALDSQQTHTVNNDDNFVLSQAGDQKASDNKIKEPQMDTNKLVSLTDLKQAASAKNQADMNKTIQQQPQSTNSQGFVQSNQNKAKSDEFLPANEQMNKNNLRTQQGVQLNQERSSTLISKTSSQNPQKIPRQGTQANPSQPNDLSSNAFAQETQATKIPTATVPANNQKQAFATIEPTLSQQNGNQSQDMQLQQLAKQLNNIMNKNGQQSQNDDMLMGMLQKLKNKMSKQPQTNNINNGLTPINNINTISSINSSSNSASTNNSQTNNKNTNNANRTSNNNDNKITDNPTETSQSAAQAVSPQTVSIQDKGTGNADTKIIEQKTQEQQQQQQSDDNQDNQQKIKDIMAKAALIDPA